jgi:hypothetical protein
MKLSESDRSAIVPRSQPYARAILLHSDLESFAFQSGDYEGFPTTVLEEIRKGIPDFVQARSIAASRFKFPSVTRLLSAFSTESDAVERDRFVWESMDRSSNLKPKNFEGAFVSAASTKERVSAMLAMHHSAHKNPQQAIGFFEELSNGSDVEIAEWARMLLLELIATATNDPSRLEEPVSNRDFVYLENKPFDLTMPLLFSGVAYTKMGGVTKKTILSPLWFERVLGEAMVCLRMDSYTTNIVLEKKVSGLHPDGTPHYELFPFAGNTEGRSDKVYLHRYWANLARPYYSSGKTELVGQGDHVINGVQMSFARVAETTAPERYWREGKPLAETVRGQFFGYGHIEPKMLLESRFTMGPGSFQLTPKLHPITGKESNTRFFGTFYGKLDDYDQDGKLDMNTRPTHCTIDGQLDYLGDGTLAKDPHRPNDWR